MFCSEPFVLIHNDGIIGRWELLMCLKLNLILLFFHIWCRI